MEKNKLLLSLTAQETLYVLESLSLYQSLILSDKFKPIIDDLLSTINEQLELQGIKWFVTRKKEECLIGKFCNVTVDGQVTTGIVLGASEVSGLIRVAISKNNELEVVDVPSHLIEKK